MNIWSLPPVRQAAELILLEALFLRHAHREMTPRERIQEARARCIYEVLEAFVAIDAARARASTAPIKGWD
jgi:hypothetical protein